MTWLSIVCVYLLSGRSGRLQRGVPSVVIASTDCSLFSPPTKRMAETMLTNGNYELEDILWFYLSPLWQYDIFVISLFSLVSASLQPFSECLSCVRGFISSFNWSIESDILLLTSLKSSRVITFVPSFSIFSSNWSTIVLVLIYSKLILSTESCKCSTDSFNRHTWRLTYHRL